MQLVVVVKESAREKVRGPPLPTGLQIFTGGNTETSAGVRPESAWPRQTRRIRFAS
jgi:hypothetical protein